MATWNDFDKFSSILNEYLPNYGEGDTKASQVSTAVNKLVYKWFNDGDVYDNTRYLEGWANDLSDYANWLYTYIPESRDILYKVFTCKSESEYTDLLYELCELLADTDLLKSLEKEQNIDSVYDCDGPFKFLEGCHYCGGKFCNGDCEEYEEDDWDYEDK